MSVASVRYDCQRTLVIRIAAITLVGNSATSIARFHPSKSHTPSTFRGLNCFPWCLCFLGVFLASDLPWSFWVFSAYFQGFNFKVFARWGKSWCFQELSLVLSKRPRKRRAGSLPPLRAGQHITEKKKAYTTTTERKFFGELFWPQRKTFQVGGGCKNPVKKPGKPYPAPKSFLCGPLFFLQRKVLHWSRAVYAFFFQILWNTTPFCMTYFSWAGLRQGVSKQGVTTFAWRPGSADSVLASNCHAQCGRICVTLRLPVRLLWETIWQSGMGRGFRKAVFFQGESNLHQIVVTILCRLRPPFPLRGISPFPGKIKTYTGTSPPLFSKKAMPWGKKWPVQMNLPFFAVKAYVPGGVQNQAEQKFEKCLPAGTGTKIYFSSFQVPEEPPSPPPLSVGSLTIYRISCMNPPFSPTGELWAKSDANWWPSIRCMFDSLWFFAIVD